MDQVDHMYNPAATGKPYYLNQYYPQSSTSHDQIGTIGIRGPPSLQNVQQRDRHLDFAENYGVKEQGLDPKSMLSQLTIESNSLRGQQPYVMESNLKGSIPSHMEHSSVRGPPETVWSPSSRMSMSITNTKGLLNGPGENNCFLNSAVQVLWHLDVFRRNFRMLTGHACMGNSCIFCALKVIFTQFQYSDQSALPPDALRKALAQNFSNEQRFQLGHMDDAAECFENILTRIHRHIAQDENEDMCNARHCIPHQKFAMTVVEQVVCNKCGATSEPHPFSQMVHYVSTSALAWHTQRMVKDGLPADDVHRAFSLLLRNASSEGDMRSCPSECGERIPIRKNLINCPDVVSIGLIWDSDRPDSDHITQVNRCIGKNIVLYHLFHLADTRSATLELRGVVCYYGKHYSTFFFTKKGIWIYFDDATVREIGPDWSRVVDKMCKGRYQPLLLLYTNPNATAIETETALQKTTMVPGHEPFNWPVNPGNNQSTTTGDSASRNSTQSQSRPAPRAGQYRRTREMPPSAVLRRAVTPNPESHQQKDEFIVEPRRAVTPTPEWHAYDSDEDSASKKQLAVDHRRQSSYLIAVTGLPEDEKPDAKGYDIQSDLTSKVAPPMVQNTGIVPDSSPGTDEVDNWTLSTNGQYRRPNAPQMSPNSTSAFNAPIFSKQGPQKRESVKKGRPKLGADIIRYQSSSDTSPSPNGQLSDGFEFNQGTKSGSEYIAGFDFSRDMEDQLRMEPLPEHIVVNPSPFPHTVKRAVSVDERLGGDITADNNNISQQQGAAAHKKRPHSARSGRTKELLDQGYGSLPRKSTRHQTISNPYYPKEYLDQKQIHELLHGNGIDGTNEQLAKKTMSRYSSESRIDTKYASKEDDVSDNNYISRRAVESILNKQKIIRQHSSSSASSGVPTPVLQRKDVTGSDERDDFCVLALNKPALKVDIPDNVSRDSGYSGDRASSASSTSADSPLLDPRHTNGAFFGRGHGPMLGGKSPYEGKSSSESLNSNQGMGNGNIQQFKTDRNLTQIPENIATFQAPKATAFFKEKLRESSKQGNKPESTEINVSKKGPMRIQKEFEGDEQEGAETFEKLCLKAEELENESFEKERRGDLHMSMWLCTQATAYFKKAMNAPGASQHSVVHAQKKHSTCVLRSRSLHRRIMSRQTSTQSTCSEVSSEDHISISSLSTTDTDTKDLDTPPIRDDPPAPSGEIPRQVSAPDLQSARNKSGIGHRGHRAEGMHRSQSVHGRMSAPPTEGNVAQQLRKPLPSYQEVMFRRSTSVSESQHRAQSEMPHSKSSDGVSTSAVSEAERGIQLYGTLPKKSKQKTGLVAASVVAAPVVEQGRVVGGSREAEIYQDYLSKQKVMQSQQQQQLVAPPGDQFDRISITSSQTVPSSLGVAPLSQSKMTKEEIRRLLQQNMMEKQRSRSSVEGQGQQGVHSRQSSTLSAHSNYSDVSVSKYSISSNHSQQHQHSVGLPTQGKQIVQPISTQQQQHQQPRQYPHSVQQPHQQLQPNSNKQQLSRHPQFQPVTVSQQQQSRQQLPGSSVAPPTIQSSLSSHLPQQQSNRIPRHAPEKIYAVPNSRPVISNHNPNPQGPKGQAPQGLPTGLPQHHQPGPKLDLKENYYAVPRIQSDPVPTSQIKSGQTRPGAQAVVNGPSAHLTNGQGIHNGQGSIGDQGVPSGQGVSSKLRQLEQQNLKLFQSQQKWQAAHTMAAPVKSSPGKKVPPPPPVRKDSVLSSPKPVQNAHDKVIGTRIQENSPKRPIVPSVDNLPLPPYPEPFVTNGTKQNGLHTRDDSYIFVEKPPEIKHSRQRSDPSSLQNGLIDLDQLGVKDLATKFETLNTNISDSSKAAKSDKSKGPLQRRRSTGSRAQRKKSVTFSENIILIGDPDESEESYEKFMHVLQQTLKRRGEANGGGGAVNGVEDRGSDKDDEDDDDDDSVDSFELVDAPSDSVLVCNLCNKRQVVEGQTYCHHCSYYMAQFQPKT